MLKTAKLILLTLALSLVSGCTLLKVVTVPVKATTKVIGGTADIID